jgi:hypothetical protein
MGCFTSGGWTACGGPVGPAGSVRARQPPPLALLSAQRRHALRAGLRQPVAAPPRVRLRRRALVDAGNTPSWVYRRRLTGRLWKTASCLTVDPHTLTQLNSLTHQVAPCLFAFRKELGLPMGAWSNLRFLRRMQSCPQLQLHSPLLCSPRQRRGRSELTKGEELQERERERGSERERD